MESGELVMNVQVNSAELQVLMTEIAPYLNDSCYREVWDFIHEMKFTYSDAKYFVALLKFLISEMEYRKGDLEELEDENAKLKEDVIDLDTDLEEREGEAEDLRYENEILQDKLASIRSKAENAYDIYSSKRELCKVLDEIRDMINRG